MWFSEAVFGGIDFQIDLAGIAEAFFAAVDTNFAQFFFDEKRIGLGVKYIEIDQHHFRIAVYYEMAILVAVEKPDEVGLPKFVGKPPGRFGHGSLI